MPNASSNVAGEMRPSLQGSTGGSIEGCCGQGSGGRGLQIVETHEHCLQGIARQPQASSVCLGPQLQRRQGIVGCGLFFASHPADSKHSPQFSWFAVAITSMALVLITAPCALSLRPAVLPYRSFLSCGRSGRALLTLPNSLFLLG